MTEMRDLELPRKIDLYATSLLSIEKKGYIDSIVLPENFTGNFYSFSSPSSNLKVDLAGKTLPLFSQEVYFRGQPIGLFTHPDSASLNTLESRTRVYYSQEEHLFPALSPRFEKWQSFIPSGLEERSLLLAKKTELHPIFMTQEKRKKTSLLFEYKKEGTCVLWLPCTISPWLKEAIKTAFPSKIYGEVLLKPLYDQYSDINLSLLFLFIAQLLFVGLQEKKNIHLHADTLLLRKSSSPVGSISSLYSKLKTSVPLYHEINISLPFSLRWQKEIFIKALKETVLLNLFPSKISLSFSYPDNHPLFYSGLEDILIPICDLIHEHIETYLKDTKLSYYKGYLANPTKKRTVLNLLLNQSDFPRKNYSYARQEIFAHEKFSFPIKKGIGLSLFQLGLELPPHNFHLQVDPKKRVITLNIPELPVHISSLPLLQKGLSHHLQQPRKPYEISLNLKKMMNSEPTFREEWDWQLDREVLPADAENPASLIEFDPSLKSQLIGCVVELKAEPWIYQIEIVRIHIVMQKGKKDHIPLEKDRLITSIQHFLYQEVPAHLRIINNWESTLDLHILEEGSGSFINLPYAFRNAFFTALRQTNVLPSFQVDEKEESDIEITYEEGGDYDS